MEVFTPKGYLKPLGHGDSNPQLLRVRCQNGESDTAVVKFKGNPQGNGILAHDLIGTQLARAMGLSTPESGIIEVPEAFLRRNPECRCLNGQPFTAGLQFATRLIPNTNPVRFRPQILMARNRIELYGVLVFDVWLFNRDRRNNVGNLLEDRTTERLYMVDQGFCFGGISSNRRKVMSLSGAETHPIQLQGHLYNLFTCDLTDPGQFARYIKVAQSIPEEDIASIIQSPPAEWGLTGDQRSAMIQYLLERRQHLDDLLAPWYRRGVRW